MITHAGGDWEPAGVTLAAMSSTQMMPMVFCASLPPWPKLYAAADSSCNRRNHRSMRDGAIRRKIHGTSTSSRPPRTNPRMGETKMNSTVLLMPADTSDEKPIFATAAPMRPPMSACDDDDGSPKNQVMPFQLIAPTRAPNTT